MKCPTCGENTPDAWALLRMAEFELTQLPDPRPDVRDDKPHVHQASFDWMHCANRKCGQLVVRAHDSYTDFSSGLPQATTDTRIVHPQDSGGRSVNPLVPEEVARDFIEAAAILNISHRMSAVLARRVLADLLEKYAGLDQFSLTARIDKFVADTVRPRELRENLHYLREMADFSAHTQTDDQLEPLNIDREEAEWTLDVVERLFDYFIVSPERDRRLREGMDAKIESAQRKAIEPLLPDSELPSASDG